MKPQKQVRFDPVTDVVTFGGELSKPENRYTAAGHKVPPFKYKVMERADAGGGCYYQYKEEAEYSVDNAYVIVLNGEVLGWFRYWPDMPKYLVNIAGKGTPEPILNFINSL